MALRPDFARLCASGIFIAVVASIAAATRFEPLFLSATSEVPAWRAAMFVILSGFGIVLANRAGLKFALDRSGLIAAIASSALVAALVIVLDGLLFRTKLAPEYLASLSEPLGLRIAFYSARSLTEEILYRLIVMSGLFWLVQRLQQNARPRTMNIAFCCAILVAQLLNVLPKTPAFFSGDLTTCIYLFMRFIVPGLVWGVLFWRYSFATAALAHMACHVILQPALGSILQR